MNKKIFILFLTILLSLFISFTIYSCNAKYTLDKQFTIANLILDNSPPTFQLISVKNSNTNYENFANCNHTITFKIKLIESNIKTNNFNQNNLKVKVANNYISPTFTKFTLISNSSNELIYEFSITNITNNGKLELFIPPNIVEDFCNNTNSALNISTTIEIDNIPPNLTLEELTKEYDYVYLAFGANVSSKMGIEGENLPGVYGGNELLENDSHPDYEGKNVIVNGGGNVAIDVARTVNRKGAKKVIIVYRRAKEQMPAEEKEVKDAENEGIEILFQNNIVKINGNERVESIELIKTKLVQKEGDTRLSPVDIEGSNYKINADYVIMALGSKTDDFVQNLGIELNKRNNIKVNEKFQTSNPKIYAGGDLAGGKGTVAWAARDGRDVSQNILGEIYGNR